MVGQLNHIQIMLDDDDRIALIHQTIQHIHQHADVFEVKPGGRFVEDIDGLSRVTLGKFGGQLHTLAFPSRQGGGRLAELDISEAHFLQHLYLIKDIRYIFKELHGTVDGHVQHIGNGFSLEAYFQRLAVVSLAVTHFARYEYIGQEVHFNGLVAVSTASFASASRYIERKASRLIATDFRFRKIDKQVADVREDTRIGGRIRTGCASQWRLVDIHYLVYIFQSLDAIVGQRVLQRTIEVLRENGLKRIVD